MYNFNDYVNEAIRTGEINTHKPVEELVRLIKQDLHLERWGFTVASKKMDAKAIEVIIQSDHCKVDVICTRDNSHLCSFDLVYARLHVAGLSESAAITINSHGREAAAAQFNAAEKVIDAQIAANQDSQWLMQQWLGSQGLPTSYPTQAALVAAYDAAREAEKQKAKEQEALNDAYQSFKQADQQSMQEYEAYQGEQEKHEGIS